MNLKRPLSVTIISWIAVGFGIVTLLMAAEKPQLLAADDSGALAAVINILSIGADILCGLWMLKGSRLARILFVANRAVTLMISGIKLSTLGLPSLILPVLVIDGIMFYFLYAPAAAQFFAGSARKT